MMSNIMYGTISKSSDSQVGTTQPFVKVLGSISTRCTCTTVFSNVQFNLPIVVTIEVLVRLSIQGSIATTPISATKQ